MDKVLKYSLYDQNKIDKILYLFCNRKEKKTYSIRGVPGNISKVTARSLEDRGEEIIENININFKGGKKVLFGIECEITKGKGVRSYRDRGVIINAKIKGDTSKKLEDNYNKFENQLTDLLTKHGIPLGRLCLETSLGCIYKFGEPGEKCEVFN